MGFRITTAAAGAVALFTASAAFADSIAPDAYSAALGLGESVTIRKTVTVDAGPPTTSKADVFFLFDTTGSMGGVIGAAKANASAILTGTAGFGDVAWGVGNYEDFPTSPWGGPADLPWRLQQAITTDQATAQAGINALTLGWGNDGPESQLHALKETATNATVGWRADSAKFIVWFGDVQGHDPVSCAAQGIVGCTNPATPGYPGPTLTQTIDALTGENITVIGVNSGWSGGGLNATGQATAITGATGGIYENSFSGDAIVDIILDSLTEAFSTYSSVSLAPIGNLPGVGVATSGPIVGAFDRSETRTFEFDVTFTGLEPGVHDFMIAALVDGGAVAFEKDSITVAPIPVPAALPLLLTALGAVGFLGRRRARG